jgi:C4-dicarboxylate-specific signal transduction histidine kinase
MHYTGMAAATFSPAPPPDLSYSVNISSLANNGISIVTLIVIVAAIMTSSVDRRARTEVERRADEALQEAQAKLARVNRVQAMEGLAAVIAHEVNQPLTAIVTNGNFCLRELTGGGRNLEELRDAIAEIVNDGVRASTVISRIRTLLVKGTPERAELDINEVIQEVAGLIRSELARNRISLLTDLTADLRVLGDRVQLQQVLINLTMNSIDAMRTIGRGPRQLLIKSATDSDEVSVQVKDSGAGFDPQQAEHIFEPFFTTKPEGIGMGLSISRSIVESHGGRLWGESSSMGALFQFTLPAISRGNNGVYD